MSTDDISDLLNSLVARGVRLFLEDGRLQCRGPKDEVTPEVLRAVRTRRDGIVARLERESGLSGRQPLSAAQHSLLFHQRMTPDSAAYNLAFAARAHGRIDVVDLDQALVDVVARHAILRTTYRWDAGEPSHWARETPAQILVEKTVPQEAVDDCVEALMDRPFDLEHELPIRAALLRTGPDDERPVLVLVAHHIAADLRSVEIILDEWMKAYAAHTSGTDISSLPVGTPFVEHVRSEARWLSGAEAERNLSFWRQQLGESPPPLNLPFDHSRPPVQTFRGDCVALEIDEELSTQFAMVARDADATPNMLFLSAFEVLLQKYSGADDVIVGTPTAGRRTPGNHDCVGYFADPVVVRTDFHDDPKFTEVLGRTRTALLRALDHPYPFPLLVERLNPERDPSCSPLFQVMYVWQHVRTSSEEVPLESLAASRQRGAPCDLVLTVRQDGQRFVCSWTYNLDLFDRTTIERLAHGFARLISEIAADPQTRVSLLPSMSASEERSLLDSARGPSADLGDGTWLDEFHAQVRRTPDAPALVCGTEVVTYGALAARVGRVAAALRAHGVFEEVRVGLCLERSTALVVMMLAIASAGGAYVPLDPGYPTDRLAYIADDAQIALCVADEAGRRALGAYDGAVVGWEALTEQADGLEPTPAAPASPDALAYLIYTSGSTGRPKGTMLTRRNVVNLFTGLDRSVGCAPPAADGQPVWLAVTSVCFDISVLELLWTLCRGYKVVVETERWARPREPVAASGDDPDTRHVDFSLFYFAADSGERKESELYRLLLDGARFADENGFRAVWVPERHFHAFGGAYPNPSVLAGAVAALTDRVEVRAGSVVLPLQDPLRVAEEWAAVDNLSHGRVGLSFASGWQPDDFVLAPDRFTDRRETMWRDIDIVRELWRGGEVARTNGVGAEIKVRTLPRPVQGELPVWATAAGSEETFRRAGEEGVNLLTHLLGQSVPELSRKIAVYRAARARAGHDEGVVTLMLHAFVHPDPQVVQDAVRDPFKNYLRSSIDLMRGLAKGLGLDPVLHADLLIEQAFERYHRTSALFGTPEACAELASELGAAGVNEIACLIDFGIRDDLIMESLGHIKAVMSTLAADPMPSADDTAGLRGHSPEERPSGHDVTHLQCTPAFARLLLLRREAGIPAVPTPRTLLVGGDVMPPELGAHLRDAGAKSVFNMYGPTETCVWSAVQQLETDAYSLPTVGGAITNTSLYALDRHLRPVPRGVLGELYIGGAGVGRGYWNRPALTAERFIPDPFDVRAGARMYQTGDVVRPLGGGRFEFVGRVDHQVKVRGFRIEFGEIEAVLGEHPGVADCAVVARRDRDGDSALVAFVVPRSSVPYEESSVRRHARSALPDYMVPSLIVDMDRLPLTLNGKVDRSALVARANKFMSGTTAYLAPRNQIEKALHGIWKGLLDRPEIGVHENFFEIGGHSLLAAKMHARVMASNLGAVELVDLFTYPTIAGLAGRLGAGAEISASAVKVIDNRASKQKKAAARLRQRRRQSP